MSKVPPLSAFDQLSQSIMQQDIAHVHGQVSGILGMSVEIAGIERHVAMGDRCNIHGNQGQIVPVEIIGFQKDRAIAMPYHGVEGIGLGAEVRVTRSRPVIYPSMQWLGRVVDAFAQPTDGGPPLVEGTEAIAIKNNPPLAHMRRRVGGKIDLGIRAMNTFLTCCEGQRMGIFSASGVGKSTLLSMIAKYTSADINVIGLVGERGREVQEFLQDDLGEEGMKRSVVVVATSDQSPLMRRQAAYVTLSIAEYFRDQGKNVLCMMDSVTRFAMAQREIGLTVGEPPASKGYTPTVFSELARLLERAGPGAAGKGSITGLFTVLVEGDDMNEPVADAARGILDGHIVLDRSIAERGRYPAVNVLRSVSRTMPDCNTDQENAIVMRARQLLATYENMADMIRLGAYRPGSDASVDEAIRYYPLLEKFLSQGVVEQCALSEGYAQLAQVLEGESAAPSASPQPAAPAKNRRTN